jgi:hypothetical protein
MATSGTISFHDYSEARMPMGFCLFFPRLTEEQRSPRRARSKKVERIMIAAADGHDRRLMTGVKIGEVLHVDLERKRFFDVLRALDDRNLKGKPIEFGFELDQDGLLQKLTIDGETIERSLTGGRTDIGEPPA